MRFESSILTFTLISLLSNKSVLAETDAETSDALFEFLLTMQDYGSSMTRPPTPRPSCKPGEYGCKDTNPPTIRPREDPPSPSPSDPPSPSPSDPPSPSPSESPTGACEVDVEITCTDADGTNCEDIVSPPPQCNTGEEIRSLTFTYIGGICDQSSNTQDDYCEDFDGGPSEEESRIVCVSENLDILINERGLLVGDTITIPSDSTAALGSEISCEISQEGEKKQSLKIRTSGDTESDDDLFLKDVFGSLQLESCDDTNCLVPITYTYTLENIGEIPMDITVLERTRDGNTVSLLDEIDDKTLESGETRSVIEEDDLDVCIVETIVTVVSAEADPEDGVSCMDEDQYVINPKPKDCRVDVEITCVDDDGTDCTDIMPPPFNCNTDGCVNELSFTYTGPPISARIICSNEDGNILTIRTLSFGDSVDLTGDLSPIITCEMFDAGNDERIKEFTIDTCEGLSLKSEYGDSIVLESCDDNDCLVPITYTYTLENIGAVEMEITELLRTRDGSTENLIGLVGDTTLEVDEFTTALETEVLDLCVEDVIVTTVRVEADPPEGEPCFDEDDYTIVITASPVPSASPSASPSDPPTSEDIPPTDSPSDSPSQPPSEDPNPCIVSVESICTPSGESQDCGTVVVTRTRCEDRPLAMVFRYNGGGCGQSDNIQNSDLFQCFDFVVGGQEGPPVDVGEESFITVTDIKGGSIVYHADFVAVGDEYTVADSPFEVEANMNISIYTSSLTLPENMLQTLVFHSSCSQNLFLKDRFGASQLVVFVNEQQGLTSCFFNATFTLNVASDASSSEIAFIQSLTSNTNYGTFNFTEQYQGFPLIPGETLTPAPTFDVVIDLTVVTNNNVFTILRALSTVGNPCRGASDFLSFTTGLALPPNVPTRAPTGAPTRTPLPTPDPEDTACEIQAIVDCDVTNGGGLLGCDNIAPPLDTQCLTGGFPRELEFVYRGGDCDSSTTSQIFDCQGNADLEEVWITIISANQNILWNRITTLETFMDLRGIDEFVSVTISTVVNGRVGVEIQTMVFATNCTEESDLKLLDTFGALELVEFTTVDSNNIAVANAAFANVEIVYAVKLQDGGTSLPANVFRANSTGGPNNNLVSVEYNPPFSPNPLIPKETLEFGKETYVLNLLDGTSLVGYTFALDVFAQNVAPNGNLLCNGTDFQEIIVA